MRGIRRNMFADSDTNSASATLDCGNGQVVGRTLSYTSPGAGTLNVYRPKQKTTANAACTNSTALTVKTDAAGKIGGAVITTNDYVLVCNTNASGNLFYLQTISNVASVSSGTVALTLGGNVYAAANDRVYIVRAADIPSFTVGAETKVELHDMFVGYPNMPVHLVLAATGTCLISGVYEIVDD